MLPSPARPRRLAALLLVLATGCGGSVVPGVLHATIDADTAHPLAEVALAIPDAYYEDFVDTQAALARALPAAVRVRVLHGRGGGQAALQRQLGSGAAARPVEWLGAEVGASAWLRDAYVAGRDPAGAPVAYLHDDRHYARMRGQRGAPDLPGLAGRLAAGRTVRTGLHAEGGAVVADDERVFVARAALEVSVQAGEAGGVAALLTRLADAWGRPVTPVTVTGLDGAEHADLVLMPIGERRILVGDPDLAVKLLEGLDTQEGKAFDARVHAIVRRAAPGHPMRALLETSPLEWLAAEGAQPERRRARARLVAELRAVGYEPIPLPFLSLDPRRGGSRLVLSYTNVLQDLQAGRRVVYLPTYGLPTLDRAAERTWQDAGFRVVRIPAVGPALYGGSLRCLTQVRRLP